jgi:nicotinic acid phosphoribosyltransferase
MAELLGRYVMRGSVHRVSLWEIFVMNTINFDDLEKLQVALAQRDALATALRRIKSLDEKNVLKYAQQIASDALILSGMS